MTIEITTQDMHRVEELASLLREASILIDDLSEGLDNMELEDEVEEFRAKFNSFTHPMN